MIHRRIKRLPRKAAALSLYYIFLLSYQEMPDAPGSWLDICGWKHLAIIALFLTSDNRFIWPGRVRFNSDRDILFIRRKSGKAEKVIRSLYRGVVLFRRVYLQRSLYNSYWYQ